ncbi:deoxyuridine 5'-triphosphate nucleotidohydrolase-like [Hibiscus syriacus]|uniref:deoxyuridine 5'-triphosphate nucleotidohydrolase-like n=1 Tax=Hibiscus syriacus TaxID=106335 RepID=UPI001924980B|nr:deoxyuridine 5'-triphosphate nucleotidohydrolase-like [Hibiscus syriacus]
MSNNYNSPTRNEVINSLRVRDRGQPMVSVANEEKKMVRLEFSVSLSKQEIEEDLMVMVGRHSRKRPKKRACYVQKELDLTEVTADSYNIPGLIGHESAVSVLRVKKLSKKAVLPSRGSPLAAGYDLSSAIDTKVPARGKALVATDLSISIPEETYARVAPRSGLAWKHSTDVGAGVIDADYRGPLGVILFNHSEIDFEVKVGDRIAQLIIEKIMTPDVLEVEDLDSTTRGTGGFGSTGV